MAGEDIKEFFQKYFPQIKLAENTSDGKKRRKKWSFARIGKISVRGKLKNGMLTSILAELVLWTLYTKQGNSLIKTVSVGSWPATHCISGCATVHPAVVTETLLKAHCILSSWTSKACCHPLLAECCSGPVLTQIHNNILRKLTSVALGLCFHLLRYTPQKTKPKTNPMKM